GARPDWVVNQTFDLFDKLGATEEQLDFPVIYASALKGFATADLNQPSEDMRPLFDAILSYVPQPAFDASAPLQLQISALDYSTYIGRIGIGRITAGMLRANQQVAIYAGEAAPRLAKVSQVFGF